jgi:predicted amidohydrolase
MPGTLTIAVAQPRCVGKDVAANALAHAAIVRAATSRLVLFPELSLTGYELDAPLVEPNDECLAPIIAACADTGAIALVGAPVQARDAANDSDSDSVDSSGDRDDGGSDGGGANIATLAVDAGGASVVYRKQWIAASESHRFSPGAHPAVISVDGWRLGLAICKDFSEEQHAADTAALGIDAYLAAMVMFADEAAEQEQRAARRALALKTWVALASFAGATGGGYANTAGGSGIWGPDGLPRARAGNSVGEFARTVLS